MVLYSHTHRRSEGNEWSQRAASERCTPVLREWQRAIFALVSFVSDSEFHTLVFRERCEQCTLSCLLPTFGGEQYALVSSGSGSEKSAIVSFGSGVSNALLSLASVGDAAYP